MKGTPKAKDKPVAASQKTETKKSTAKVKPESTSKSTKVQHELKSKPVSKPAIENKPKKAAISEVKAAAKRVADAKHAVQTDSEAKVKAKTTPKSTTPAVDKVVIQKQKSVGKKSAPAASQADTTVSAESRTAAKGRTKKSDAPVLSVDTQVEETAPRKRKYTRRSSKKIEKPVVQARYKGRTPVAFGKRQEAAPVQAPASLGVQYPASDLEYFREIINEKIQDAMEELSSIEERLMDSATGDFHEDDATYSLHMAEQGTDAMEREKAFLFAQRERKFISHLNDALQRIKSGNYGVCIACSNLIEKGRLEAVPHARMCVSCKNHSKGE